MTALFARNASRDLFDAHYLLTKTHFNTEQLRLAFILYLGMSSIKDFQKISPEALLFDEGDFQQQLLPVLRNAKKQANHHAWKAAKLEECKQGLEKLLPFADHEMEFLKKLSNKGDIQASLLTGDSIMQSKIEKLPLLRWRASLTQSFAQHKESSLNDILQN